MYVERVLSINSGWAILTNQKQEEWAEAQAALHLINDEFIIDGPAHAIDEFLENGFMPYYMYNMYNSYLASKFDWPDTLQTAKNTVNSQLNPKALKNGVSASIVEAEVMGTEDFLTSIYVTIPYYYNTGRLEVSVILIPTNVALLHIFDLGIEPRYMTTLPTEATCREVLAKFGQLTSQVPIVLAFFSPTASENIIIEETTSIKVSGHTIERTIEFAPEFYQAGVGLLSYFGEILRQKDPNTKAKVRIEQDGNTVRLHIVPPIGKAEIVEKQLEQFALVISKQAAPDSLLDNPGQLVQLKAQLRMAQMQIETAYDLKQLTAGIHAQDVRNLEQKIDILTQQVAQQVLQQSGSYEIL